MEAGEPSLGMGIDLFVQCEKLGIIMSSLELDLSSLMFSKTLGRFHCWEVYEKG